MIRHIDKVIRCYSLVTSCNEQEQQIKNKKQQNTDQRLIMRTIYCCVSNYLLGLAYYKKRNNKEYSFDGITNFYCVYT